MRGTGFTIRPLGEAWLLERDGVPLCLARIPEDGSRRAVYAALRAAGEAHVAIMRTRDEEKRRRLVHFYREAIEAAQNGGKRRRKVDGEREASRP